jgi:hypothetical protein
MAVNLATRHSMNDDGHFPSPMGTVVAISCSSSLSVVGACRESAMITIDLGFNSRIATILTVADPDRVDAIADGTARMWESAAVDDHGIEDGGLPAQ